MSIEGSNVERQEVSESEVDFNEGDFRRLLDTVPRELAQSWEDEFDGNDVFPGLEEKEHPEFFARFQEFLNKRKLAFVTSFEIESDVDKGIVEEIMSTQEVISNTFGDTQYFIGDGMAADVYILPTAPHLCVKYLKVKDDKKLRKEVEFLRKLRLFVSEGVRTPVPYFVQNHPGEGSLYGMEKINGKSLSQILDHPQLNADLIDLVKKMDREEVEKRLRTYVDDLHTKFNIVHNDIALRNLMLDEEGNFFVIDFGKSEFEEFGDDYEIALNSDNAKIKLVVGNFFKEIDKISLSDIVTEDFVKEN
jgi:tRNA A-37 threonylcarbamoyl transferase component Bud32